MGKRTKISKQVAEKSHSHHHPDHQEHIPRLRRAQGQVDAVARMIYEREYCPSILQQLRAATAALKALEASILKTHLEHCVRDAMKSKNEANTEKKINELITLFKRGNE